jgi:Kef-type K+ transport system membrane component KefB
MLAAVALAYWGIRSVGEFVSAPAPSPSASLFGGNSVDAHFRELYHLLLALIVVIALARGLGTLFRAFNQPPVIGEIIAGILLGPSLLGRIAPAIGAYVLPAQVAPLLGTVSQIGVILYMFLVGVELDPALLRQHRNSTIGISHASIVAPFVMGAALALILYPRYSSADVPFTVFSLFIGVSMSVTAFPVLARILTDRGIHRSRMGAVALACGAIDDVTAWCLLAIVVGAADARSRGGLGTIAGAIAYGAFMIAVVRPAMMRLSRIYGNRGRLTQGVMAAIFVALLASSLATEAIGIHAVFGAFALGALIPHDSGMARELTDRLEDLVVVLLLPAFFAFTGLRTQIGLVSGASDWLICGLIIAVASAGKFLGSAIAARISGMGWRDASALGVLMNTRGLMELIVLNIGLELHVISPTLFAMLVVMALVTTFATTPILHWITRRETPGETAAFAPVHRAALVGTERLAVLVPIANPDAVPGLLELAFAATPTGAPPPRILALVRVPYGGVRSGLREAEQRVPPRSQALSAALDFSWSRGMAITAQSVWSADPAADIAAAAAEPQVGWLLLGSHRAVFGSDFRGGIVGDVLDRIRTLPIHAGIVIPGSESSFDSVTAVADSSDHGRAALELAARVAEQRRISPRAIVLTQSEDGGAGALEFIREIERVSPRKFRTQPVASDAIDEIERLTQSGLVIVGTDLANRLGALDDSLNAGNRTVVVVQGCNPAVAREAAQRIDRARAAR